MARRRALGITLTLAAGALAVAPLPAAAQTPRLVISQLYGGGGVDDPALQYDFVELHNTGQTPVVLDGLSLQYAAPFGFGVFGENPITQLTGTVPAGGYFLVRLDGDPTVGTPLTAVPDQIGVGDINQWSGKLALVAGPDALPCNGGTSPCDLPTRSRIVDLVGYGAADFFEGTNGAAQGTSETTGIVRAGNGCTDTDDNLADFAGAAPVPRNSGSAPVACAAPPPPPPPPGCLPAITIAAIQGSGPLSPWLNFNVSTSGVVTARYAATGAKGFFLQMAAGDGDDTTSDGIFVSTGALDPPADAAVGNEVCVEAQVRELVPGDDLTSRPTTVLAPTRIALIATGRPLPAPVTISSALAGPGATLDALERFEGMRVRVATLTVIAPTSGVINETAATAASTGVFYGVVSGVPRPFREPGVDVHDGVPPGAPPDVPVFDANLERIRVDSAALGLAAIDVATGATLTNVVGPLHYGQRTPTILVSQAPGVTASAANAASAAAPAPRSTEFTAATVNAGRLFDTTDSPGHTDALPTSAALTRRLSKLSLQIRNVLRSPDFVAVQEVETLALLQALASRINSDAVSAGQPSPGYQPYLIDGLDASGLDVGLLVRSTRVTVQQVTQEGREATFVDPLSLTTEVLNDRPPLVVRATVALPGGPVPLTLIVTHLRSMRDIAGDNEGDRVRAKRAAQAEFLAGLIQDRQAAAAGEPLVVLGDFNAYPFNDGYVDVVGTAAGTPAEASQVTLGTTDLVEPDLSDALDGLQAATRYTVTDGGNAAALHHVLVNGAAAALQSRAWVAHVNADFPETLRNDASRAERAAAADVPIVYFEVAPAQEPPKTGPREITSQVRVKVWRSHYFWHYRGVTFALVDVTNLTNRTIDGPFVLGIGGLPAGASVTNARGTVAGLPAVPVNWWHQLRPGRTMRAWVVLKGVPVSTTPTVRVFTGKLTK
jgi:predicted extracellular nuclease